MSYEIETHFNSINRYLSVFHKGYSLIMDDIGRFWIVYNKLSGEKCYIRYDIYNPNISDEVYNCMSCID